MTLRHFLCAIRPQEEEEKTFTRVGPLKAGDDRQDLPRPVVGCSHG